MTDADNIPRRFQRSVHHDAAAHHFRLGQAVRLKGGVLRSSEVFVITARLPMNGDSPQYRIRTDNERFERMAIESELEAVNPSPRADGGAFAEASATAPRATPSPDASAAKARDHSAWALPLIKAARA
jgi:hypothetical protein